MSPGPSPLTPEPSPNNQRGEAGEANITYYEKCFAESYIHINV